MRAYITEMSCTQDTFGRHPVVEAKVRLACDPADARAMMGMGSQSKPFRFVTEEEHKRLTHDFGIKSGDQVRYWFLRGGSDPEQSIWMEVESVRKDNLTVIFCGEHGRSTRYRILLCQVIEHKTSGFARADHVHTIPTSDDVNHTHDVSSGWTHFKVKSQQRVDLVDMTPRPTGLVVTDPNAALRKRVEEFNLT